MNTSPSTPAAKSTGLELHALTSAGARRLDVAATAGNMHDVMDVVPFGIYSALRTFGHDRFLWLDAHLDRTEQSMALAGWTTKLDRGLLRAAVVSIARGYPLAEAMIRFDVLREPATIQGVEARVFIAVSPFVPVPASFAEAGVRVVLARHLRREAPLVKTTEFVHRRRPFPRSTQEEYEGVMLDDGDRILECTSANIGFVQGSRVIAAGDGVLEGITAKVLRRVAPAVGLTWVDRRLPLAEVGSVDEAFLSSSSRGVVPIVRIADTTIGDGKVGARTRALREAYYAFAEKEAR